MSTSVASATYRKLDVDSLEVDKFDEEQENCCQEKNELDEKQIDMLLQGGRYGEALHLVLKNAPVDIKITDRATLIAAKVLKSFRVSEIETAVSGLNEKEADLLIRLVYRCFEMEPEGALLQWHAQIVSRFGKGSIVRVLTSRNAL